jgi:hypothetical protein
MDQLTGKSFGETYIEACTKAAVVLAFVVVIPLTLWFAWARHSVIVQSVVQTVFCLSFAWMGVAILRWFRDFRRLHQSSSTRLLLGPQPDDPDELRAWKSGRQFRYAALTVVLSMIAVGITLWLNGE